MRKILTLLLLLPLALSAASGRGTNYVVEVDCGDGFVPVTVYKALCSDSAAHHPEIWNDWNNSKALRDTMSIALVECPGDFPLRVRVRRRDAFSDVRIRPTHYGIVPEVVDNHTVEFLVDEYSHRKISVEFDDDRATNLFLICNIPDREKPSSDDPSVIYYGPGEHREEKVVLKQGQTLYVDYGAVLYAAVEIQGSDCRIAGHGIITGAELPHTGTQWASGELLIECNKDRSPGRRNLVIEDVTIIDSPSWTVSVYNMSDVRIENINLVNWILNGDGIDVVCSREVLLKDCFIRCYDDCITLKVRHNAKPMSDLENIQIEGCLIWADFARGVVIGPEAGNETVSSGAIRNCTVSSCIFLEHNTIAQKDDVRGAFAIHQIKSPEWKEGRPPQMQSIVAKNLYFDHLRSCSRAIVIAQDENSVPGCVMSDVELSYICIDDDGTAASVFEARTFHNRIDGLKLSHLKRNGKALFASPCRGIGNPSPDGKVDFATPDSSVVIKGNIDNLVVE